MNSFNIRLSLFYLTILLFVTSIFGFVRELFTTIVLIQEVDNEDSSCLGIFVNLTTLATACSCIGHYSSQAWIPRTIVILYHHGIIISSDIKSLRCVSKSYERGLGAVLLNPESILYRKSETKYIPVAESYNEQDCYTVGQMKFNNLQSSLHDLFKLHDVKCIPVLPKRICKKLEFQGDRTMNPTVLKGSPVVCSGFLFGIAFPGKEGLVELITIKKAMYVPSFGLSGSRRICANFILIPSIISLIWQHVSNHLVILDIKLNSS